MNEKTFYSLDVYENDIDGLESEKYVRIDYIKVAPEERGQGIARKLLREAILEAKTYNLPIFMVASELEPETDLARLVNFYEDEGFSIYACIGDSVLMKY